MGVTRKATGVVAVLASILATAVVVAGAAGGCDRGDQSSSGGAGTPGRPVRLAFVTSSDSEFSKIAAAGVRRYEGEGNVRIDVKMPPNGTTEEQNQILESLVSEGYDAIAVSAIAPEDQVPVLNRAAEKTVLLTFDSDAPASSRMLYIGTNNFEAGKVLGEQIVKLLPQGGKMAVFVGTLSADSAGQRLGGIQEAIKGKNIEIVDKREDNADPAKARSNVEDVIKAHADLNLVVGLSRHNGPAIAAAIEASGRKGKVKAAVFDEEDGTLKGISDGTIQVAVVQKPFEFGYRSSKWMHDLVVMGEAGKTAVPAEKVVDTGVEVIDAKNVDEFKTKLAELKK